MSAVAVDRRSPVVLPLADLADTLAAEIAPRAAQHDRDGTFPRHSLAAVEQSGYLAAPIPAELGGLGVGADTTSCSRRAASRRATRRSRSG